MGIKRGFQRTASALVALSAIVSQVPAFAQDVPAESATVIAQSPSATVLQGSVSNVDTLTRDVLKSEIKLEKFNMNYRLNAAKQGRWKGWRYFALQETALGLVEADLISMTSYRGHGIHHPERVHKGVAANGTVLPAFIGFIVSGGGDALEFGINAYHQWEAGRNGFSQTQSRKYVAGLVANIDRKLADREALLRQEPSSDAEVANAQELEGKVLRGFRDAAIAEFERFHIGTSSTLANQQAFYLLDMAQTATGAIWSAMTMHLILKGKERMCTSSGILFVVNAAQTMLDPLLAYGASRVAAKLDERSLVASGLPAFSSTCTKLVSDCNQLHSWAATRTGSSDPVVTGLSARVSAYDRNSSYYSSQIENYNKSIINGRRTAMMNFGWGTYIGGSKLPFGILPIIAGTKLMRGKVVNSYYFTGSTVLLPAISIAILDSWRSQISGEKNFRRLRNQHLLPSQLIETRLAQLDQLEAQM